MVIEKLRTIKDFSNLKEILINKDLAKLGDTFLNFVYSLAKSGVLSKFDGWKIPDKVLAQALRDAEMRKYITQRASSHDLGDAVEALVVHEWLFQKITIEEITDILFSHLKTGDLSDRIKEARAAVQAITALLLRIKKDYETLR
ncbi:MAG: ribonuclease III family protein [Candidatus Helarchaeota archaeon]